MSPNVRTRARSAVAALAAALCLALAARPAAGYTRSESHWNPASLPIGYRINLASAPASIGAAGAQSAIVAGMSAWSAPTCTRWSATFLGNTSLGASASDRQNVMLWVSGSWPAELGDVNSTIGVTTPVWIVGGYYVDADIQFNNVGFRWSLTGAAGTVDTQSIATHEEGHFFGLNHSTIRGAVMYPTYPGGVVRSLASDDVAGVCAIYPSGGPVPDAGVPSDPCSAYSSCAGCTPNANCGWCASTGRCHTGTSAGANGGACGAGWTWQPSDCGRTTTDAGVSDPCRAYASCGTCTPVAGCGWCAAAAACMTGTSAGPTRTPCAGGWAWQPTECRGDPCAAYAACGTCTPIAGCGWCGATGRCLSGTISGPTGTTCSSGWAWYETQCGAATPGTAAFGEPCRASSDCASGGFCVNDGTATYCSRRCSDDCTCPRGYRCVPTRTAGLSVCARGTNACTPDAGPAPVDSGPRDVVTAPDTSVRPDVVTPPRDTGVAADVGAPPDVVETMDDAGAADMDGGADARTGTPRTRHPTGCGCSAPGQSASPWGARGVTIALAGVAALVARRRKQR